MSERGSNLPRKSVAVTRFDEGSTAAVGDAQPAPGGEVGAESRARILVVDDDALGCQPLVNCLRQDGHDVRSARGGAVALAHLGGFDPDVVLTDLMMPDVDGIALIERGRGKVPHAAFIVMTGHASISTAVAAIKKGAEDYLTKPLELDEVSAVVGRALQRVMLSKAVARSLRQRVDRSAFGNIVGNHPLMQRLMSQVAQVAPSRASVLITGESGTGKELVASAIHYGSNRRDEPFVRLNCAALASTLLESELFGHERGSYTGAVGRRDGRFTQADGGTLFLDEVSEIPPSTQVKLLRVLQEREFERVGGNQTLRVDVRVVAATNRDLAHEVRAGRFREDLYFRLKVVELAIPPLRARRSDIPSLAHVFLRQAAKANHRDMDGFTPEAVRCMLEYAWPGNVRELENAVERAVVLSTGPRVTEDDLHLGANATQQESFDVLVPGIPMHEVERLAILRTLEAVGGSTSRAAKVLGISRRKIQYRLREWGVDARQLALGDLARIDLD